MNHSEAIVTGFYELLSTEHRERKQSYNRMVKGYKYFKAHPYQEPGKDEITLLVGFSNDNSTYTLDALKEIGHNARKAFFTIVESTMSHLTGYKDADSIQETVVVECSTMPLFEMEQYTWNDVRNFPSLRDSPREVLLKGFTEYFQYQYERESHYSNYFWKDDPIPNVELRLVWNDVCRDGKYGNRTTLILWDGKLIGHVTETSKWLDVHTYFIHNEEEWHDFMRHIHQLADAELGEFTPEYDDRPYTIIDGSVSAEDWISIPGVTTQSHKGEW